MTKVLVVDDEPDAVGFLGHFLEGKGLEVVTAERGEEALTKIHREQPDIVLLDIMMPGMGGLEVLQRLRFVKNRPDVIMITARIDKAEEAMKLGAFDYVLKPVDLEYLERVLWWKIKMRV